MPSFTTHVFDIEKDKVEDYLPAILKLEKECFPPDWQYEDAEGEYRKNLESKSDINVFLLNENKDVVGYLLAVPHNDVVADLKPYDPKFEEKEGFYYIETVQISSKYRGAGGFDCLINALTNVSKLKNINGFTIHARTSNRLDSKIKKQTSESCLLNERNIDFWKFGGGEPYKYMEWKI